MLKKFICNKSGAACLELAIIAAASLLFLYVAAQLTSLIILSGRTMVGASAAVQRKLNTMTTPCLEDAAVGDFADGRYKLASDLVNVGIGKLRKGRTLTHEVIFLVDKICN